MQNNMNKEFEAYHSRLYPWMFVAVSLIIDTVNIVLNLLDRADITVTFLLALMSALPIVMFFRFVFNKGIAIEIIDDTLILHGKEITQIFISDIKAVSLHTSYGSFDMYVKTVRGEKHSIHCFIKGDKIKKKELYSILEAKGVDPHTFDVD